MAGQLEFFGALEAQGVMDDLVIIITADHGENMGQLGIYGEHGTADHVTCHIPMIIRWLGGQKGTVDTGLHYHLDLGSTMAELLGKSPSKSWDGQSYAPAITEKNAAASPLWMVMKEGGPFHAKGHLQHYIERLKVTGREGAIAELVRRHPGEMHGLTSN